MSVNLSNISIADEAFEHKVNALKQRLKSRMNGKTTEQMQNGQIDYALNYGVSLQHVRELADELDYTPSDCTRLWQLNIREAMLIAAIKMPSEKATATEMIQWASIIRTPDMVEQGAFFLFWRAEGLETMIEMLLQKTQEPFALAIAFFAAGRALQKKRKINNSIIEQLLSAVEYSKQLNSITTRGASFLLRQVANTGAYSMRVKDIITTLKSINAQWATQLAFEVECEL